MKAIIIGLALIIAIPTGALAKEKSLFKEDDSDKKAPLKVTSDKMVTSNKENKIVFTGSVVAVKGKLTVESDKLTVWTDEDQTDFTEILAEGAVRIVRGKKIATGKVAHYYSSEKKIVLTGDPVLKDGKDTATGARVIYFFDREDMVIVGNSKKRSSVVLFPKKKEKKPTVKGGKEVKKHKSSGSDNRP